MEGAGLKGLDPLDYDGDLWAGRIAALSTGPAQEAFDVAFTAGLTRYASHLQIGRINPAQVRNGLRRRCRAPDRIREINRINGPSLPMRKRAM